MSDSGAMSQKNQPVRFGWLFALLCSVLLLHLGACSREPVPGYSTASPEKPARSQNADAVRTERYDLARDEQRGGHTLEKHVSRSDEQLQERLFRERNISAASTWTDRETAEEIVAQGLRGERGRVESWMSRGYPRANLALHYNAGRSIGRSLRRGEEQAADCSDAVIVLRADGPNSFYVLTAYPEARK
jgi:hypothetical protein